MLIPGSAVRVACALWAVALLGDLVPLRAEPHGHAPLVTTEPLIRESLERIAAGSALWRSALERIAAAGRQAIVLTPGQVVVADSPGAEQTRRFAPGVLAEVAPVAPRGTAVDTVLVVINLPLITELHDRNNALPAELHGDLDRILVHEIFGHAVPYLLAGDLSGHCADPAPGQRATDACAIQRENAVRAELRLGTRLDSGLGSLALARGFRDWR